MSIKIDTINCRGLAKKVQRNDFFSRCSENYDISILIDTHCNKEKENKRRQEWGYTSFFSSHTENSRGIAVFF